MKNFKLTLFSLSLLCSLSFLPSESAAQAVFSNQQGNSLVKPAVTTPTQTISPTTAPVVPSTTTIQNTAPITPTTTNSENLPKCPVGQTSDYTKKCIPNTQGSAEMPRCPFGQIRKKGSTECEKRVYKDSDFIDSNGLDKDSIFKKVEIKEGFFEKKYEEGLKNKQIDFKEQDKFGKNESVRKYSDREQKVNAEKLLQEMTGMTTNQLIKTQVELLKQNHPNLFDKDGNINPAEVQEIIETKVDYYHQQEAEESYNRCPAGQVDPDGDGFCEEIKTDDTVNQEDEDETLNAVDPIEDVKKITCPAGYSPTTNGKCVALDRNNGVNP